MKMQHDSVFIAALRQGEYTKDVLMTALMCEGEQQEQLFALARECRTKHFPDNRAQVRSVIEISNVCRQKCRYCIIGANDQKFDFTLDQERIVMLIRYLYGQGRRTILLQSGENLNRAFIDEVVAAVTIAKREFTDLRIILASSDIWSDGM